MVWVLGEEKEAAGRQDNKDKRRQGENTKAKKCVGGYADVF